MSAKILTTWEAATDIFHIAEYIELKFGRPRADQFQNDILEQISSLSKHPNAFSKTDILYRGYLIQKKVFSPSIIFYLFIEEKNEVHILRVLREESNWAATLQHDPNYTYPET